MKHDTFSVYICLDTNSITNSRFRVPKIHHIITNAKLSQDLPKDVYGSWVMWSWLSLVLKNQLKLCPHRYYSLISEWFRYSITNVFQALKDLTSWSPEDQNRQNRAGWQNEYIHKWMLYPAEWKHKLEKLVLKNWLSQIKKWPKEFDFKK